MTPPGAHDRHHAPATRRNRAPIADVLRGHLPAAGLVVEVASGTGEHIVWFAEQFPDLIWQPSDPDSLARASIAAWIEEAGLPNIRAPIAIDASARDWPVDRADAILCINMIHISPWSATEGLFAEAARLLPTGRLLFTYGAYKRNGEHTAPSNAAFDAGLRAQNPDWGVRDVAEVEELADRRGFDLTDIVAMPANNFSLFFRRR